MTKNIKNLTKVADNKINAFGKNIGLNYFERRRLVKGVHAFAYDTGVNVASTLIITGIEQTAYLAGHLVATTACGVVKVVTGTVEAAGNAVEHAKAKVEAKKEAKALASAMEEDEIEEVEADEAATEEFIEEEVNDAE